MPAANDYLRVEGPARHLAAKWRGSMWHVDATHDTLLTIANAGTKPAQARLILLLQRRDRGIPTP
jgi:hypothetical protein